MDISEYIPQHIEVMITGGSTSIDKFAERYADERSIPKLILKPDYEKYGKRAPLVRNKEIIDLADMLLAFWDGKSRWTKSAIDYAKRVNIPLNIYLIKNDNVLIF